VLESGKEKTTRNEKKEVASSSDAKREDGNKKFDDSLVFSVSIFFL